MITLDEKYNDRYSYHTLRMVKVFNNLMEEYPRIGAENDTRDFERLLEELQEIIEYYVGPYMNRIN